MHKQAIIENFSLIFALWFLQSWVWLNLFVSFYSFIFVTLVLIIIFSIFSFL